MNVFRTITTMLKLIMCRDNYELEFVSYSKCFLDEEVFVVAVFYYAFGRKKTTFLSVYYHE